MKRTLALLCLLALCAAAGGAQEAAGTALTNDERVEYHQLLEQTRQAQLDSLAKQLEAQQQISSGYQQAAEGLAALLQSVQRAGSSVGAKNAALRQWMQERPGRDCAIGRDGRVQCPAPSESRVPAPPEGHPPTPPREAPAR